MIDALDRFVSNWACHRMRRRAPIPAAGTVAGGSGTRVHAVYETTEQAVYLGFRLTDELNPDGLANLGHGTAMLRASDELLNPLACIALYVEVDGGSARRWRLHRRSPGTDPVITDPPDRVCQCGLPLDPPDGIEYWQPDRHPEPGPEVYAVAICGECPAVRRAVRREDGTGWRERGTGIHFPGSITWDWPDVGRCRAGVVHPVRRLGL